MKPIDIFGPPSLGNASRDAKNLAALLRNMDSGISTYQVVFDALQSKYGRRFTKDFYREVRR